MKTDPLDLYPPRSLTQRALPLLVVVTIVLGGVLAWQLYARPGRLFTPDAESRPITPRGDLAADEISTIQIFEKAAPSVVHISNLRLSGQIQLEGGSVRQGTGTGVIWDPRGYIVTNYHVVEGGNLWRIHLHDGSSHDARYVGGDPSTDVAVLKIDANGSHLVALDLGTSHDLQVGQKVFAIGNPFGLDRTLTTGVISGLNRKITSGNNQVIRGVIQTDAAINPGNSGGPLLDSAGRLIGINTAIISPSGSYAGIGFAVPVNAINRLVPRIMRTGFAERAGLGIVLFNQDSGEAGARVGNVIAGSAAERAGLLPTRYGPGGQLIGGDLIVALDDERILNGDDLLDSISRHEVGDKVKLRVRRGRRELDIEVVLQALSSKLPKGRRR